MYPWYKDPYSDTDHYVGHSAETAGSGIYTAEEIVTGWMNSPPHKRVILAEDLTYVGIAYSPRIYNNHPSGYYWALELLSVS